MDLRVEVSLMYTISSLSALLLRKCSRAGAKYRCVISAILHRPIRLPLFQEQSDKWLIAGIRMEVNTNRLPPGGLPRNGLDRFLIGTSLHCRLGR